MKLKNKIRLWFIAHWATVAATIIVVAVIVSILIFACWLVVWSFHTNNPEVQAVCLFVCIIAFSIVFYAATERRK